MRIKIYGIFENDDKCYCGCSCVVTDLDSDRTVHFNYMYYCLYAEAAYYFATKFNLDPLEVMKNSYKHSVTINDAKGMTVEKEIKYLKYSWLEDAMKYSQMVNFNFSPEYLNFIKNNRNCIANYVHRLGFVNQLIESYKL